MAGMSRWRHAGDDGNPRPGAEAPDEGQGTTEVRSQGEVGHVVPVHDVDREQIRAPLLQRRDVVRGYPRVVMAGPCGYYRPGIQRRNA